MTIIRGARAADAAAVARIYVEGWRDAYPGLIPGRVLLAMSPERQVAEWRRLIAAGARTQRVLVAEEHGGVVGFGSAGRARHARLGHQGEVFTLYVDTDHRGQGVGRALLQGLFAALARDGMDSALVWVLAENPARFFYEALGGRFLAQRRERLWGALLPQAAYGWLDLAAAARGPRAARAPRGQ